MLVSVSDRLGDHGPSGVVIYRWSENLLVVEGFSLSCTVLGKQVEYAVISALARMAVERACSKLVFEFRQSGRNQPMLSFLQSVADREAESQYVIFADTADARVSAKAVNPGAWSMKYPEAKTDSAHSGD
jgi:predicted enzyme involved in methoxymalonyl-ACP biosynthesis